MRRIVFLVWAKYHRRSEILARHLNARLFYVVSRKRGGRWAKVAKYTVQTIRTWRILIRENPAVVFVQNPPIFCALAADLYGRMFGSELVIDSHTGAFLTPGWRRFLGLHRRLSRRALMTIVHNRSQEEIVRGWGCPFCVIGFTPGDYPLGEPFPLGESFNVAVVSTAGDDEPLDALFEAAERLPGVDFYVTGESDFLSRSLRERLPGNCHLTGYLSYDRYVGLLRGVDVIMDLTTRDHTLLMGAFEAVSLAKPLIVSDWPILRDYFDLGTICVANTAEGIREGVGRARRDLDLLKKGIRLLAGRLEAEWERQFFFLRRSLAGRRKA